MFLFVKFFLLDVLVPIHCHSRPWPWQQHCTFVNCWNWWTLLSKLQIEGWPDDMTGMDQICSGFQWHWRVVGVTCVAFFFVAMAGAHTGLRVVHARSCRIENFHHAGSPGCLPCIWVLPHVVIIGTLGIPWLNPGKNDRQRFHVFTVCNIVDLKSSIWRCAYTWLWNKMYTYIVLYYMFASAFACVFCFLYLYIPVFVLTLYSCQNMISHQWYCIHEWKIQPAEVSKANLWQNTIWTLFAELQERAVQADGLGAKQTWTVFFHFVFTRLQTQK